MKHLGIILLSLLACSCSILRPKKPYQSYAYCGLYVASRMESLTPKISVIVGEVAGNPEVNRIRPVLLPSGTDPLEVLMPYPEQLRVQGITGEVTAQLSIEKDGTVSNVTVLHSSNKEFEAPVLTGAGKLRFQPATTSEGTVSCTANCVFKFELADGMP